MSTNFLFDITNQIYDEKMNSTLFMFSIKKEKDDTAFCRVILDKLKILHLIRLEMNKPEWTFMFLLTQINH